MSRTCARSGVHVRKVMSWDDGFPGARASRPHKDGFPGARASRPHQAWHSSGHLPHLDQPGMAPWLSFGLADAVPADRVAACSIALTLSGGQRDRMRAGRSRSQAIPAMRRPGGAVGGVWRATSQKADVHPARSAFVRHRVERPLRKSDSNGLRPGLPREGSRSGRPPG